MIRKDMIECIGNDGKLDCLLVVDIGVRGEIEGGIDAIKNILK
ncbi:hypothetical protein [Staphylococcus pasteuri]|nr:hypothetical protein [Staphylococcus pasteuri]